jgi:hypothetical protein
MRRDEACVCDSPRGPASGVCGHCGGRIAFAVGPEPLPAWIEDWRAWTPNPHPRPRVIGQDWITIRKVPHE